MADSTTAAEKTVSSAATKAAVNRAAKEAVSAAVAEQALPLVAETTELALEVPSKVVLNQKVVFTVGVLGGVALGAGLLYGVSKFVEARKIKKAVAKIPTTENEKNAKPNA